tara:strand:- start:406 stop:630 length:225 start_codon:yes stop_codon:yes gene_type:complete
MSNTTINKADTMNRYHVSFDIVCTFTGEHKVSFSGSIEADTAELAVIFAREQVRKEQRIFGKAVNIKTFQLTAC